MQHARARTYAMGRQLSSYRGGLAALLLVLASRSMRAGTPSSQTGGTVNASGYPKRGHAPDYSWVAGQVAFTQIQGGCIYVRTGPETGATQPPDQTAPGQVIVGTAVRSD